MDFFNYKNTSLYAEDIAVTALVKQHGTPLYVYSRATIERHWHAFDQAAGDRPHIVCYAVKANSNIAVLNVAQIFSRLLNYTNLVYWFCMFVCLH